MRKKAHRARAIVKAGGSPRPCSGVINQGRNQSRPLIFEDETPGESRFRRVGTGVPPNGRVRSGGPGMPLEMRDPEDEDPASMSGRSGSGSSGRDKFSAPKGPWWRPASTVGRVVLGLGAL